MYYVIYSGKWSANQGWSYDHDIEESGEVASLDELDYEGVLIDSFNSGFIPDYSDGHDIRYAIRLYPNKGAYENDEQPIEEKDIWESEVWKGYSE